MPTRPIGNHQSYTLSLYAYLNAAHLESPQIPDQCWGGRKYDCSMLQPHILILMIIHKQHEVVHVNTWRSRHFTQHLNPFTPPPPIELFPSAAGIYSDAITASPNDNSHISSPHTSQDVTSLRDASSPFYLTTQGALPSPPWNVLLPAQSPLVSTHLHLKIFPPLYIQRYRELKLWRE